MNELLDRFSRVDRLGDWRKLLGEKVRLVAGTDNGIVENGRRRVLNLGEYRHWIGLMRQGGADGVYFFNFPLRPYRDETWRGILGEGNPGPEPAK